MIKYSIIVPVYNVEKVLGRCIESILDQTVVDFELILIDDGSTDKSGMICDQYQKKDTRIKVVHKKNEGVSKARNVGLDMSEGEYIIFVDSDDYIDNNYLKVLEKNDSDLFITGMRTHDINGEILGESSSGNMNNIIKSEKDLIDFLKEWYAIVPFAKCYKKELIEENDLRFNESFNYGEDSIFVAEYLLNCKKVFINQTVTYNFCKYDTPTLSKIEEGKWFEKYSLLQQELYGIFKIKEKNETAQYILDKYWWVAETELKRISKKSTKTIKKKKEIDNVLKLKFFQYCMKVNKNIKLSFIKKVSFSFKSTFLVLKIYAR